MVRRWRFFCVIFGSVFPASRVQHISDLHSKFALRRYCAQRCATVRCAAQRNAALRRATHRCAQCGLSANLECRSEMCCTRLAGSTESKNDAKKVAICAPSQRRAVLRIVAQRRAALRCFVGNLFMQIVCK